MSKKICLILDCLSSGGAEKLGANLSISFSNEGYHVTVVSMRNMINYQYSGALYNFGLVKEQSNRFAAFLKIKRFFKENQFDVIIDHRVRDLYLKELIFSKLVFNSCNVIYCVHNYKLDYYFSLLKLPKLSVIPHVKNAQFVSVCSAIQTHLYNKLNIKSTRIYNYVLKEQLFTQASEFESTPEKSYILGVGRLSRIKQFDVLISCYAKSDLPKNNIKLKILGNGPKKEKLVQLISKLKLNNHIELVSFKENPFGVMQAAKCLVMTSVVEGFPMVLIESLTLKVPVISFDFKSGPNEIVKHNINGMLVEDQNQQELTRSLNKLLDDELYAKLKLGASQDLKEFSEEKILKQWNQILETFK